MATRTRLGHIDEEGSVCNLCSEHRNGEHVQVLPCEHSFCGSCLRVHVEKNGVSSSCPVCRSPFGLPSYGVTVSQGNGWVGGVFEQSAGERRGAEANQRLGKCEGCEEGVSDVRCIDCNLKLCRTCERVHKRVPATKSHRLDYTGDHSVGTPSPTEVVGVGMSVKNAIVRCKQHPDNEVKFYCDTCRTLVCLECTVIDHRVPQHQHRYLKDVATGYLSELSSVVSRLRDKQSETTRCKTDTLGAIYFLDTCFKEAETKIYIQSDKLLRKVKRDRERLLQELRDGYRCRKAALEEQLHELHVTENKLADARVTAETVLVSGNPAHALLSKDSLTARAETLLGTEAKRNLAVDDMMEFRRHHQVHGMDNTVGTLVVTSMAEYVVDDVFDLDGDKGTDMKSPSTVSVVDSIEENEQMRSSVRTNSRIRSTFPSTEGAADMLNVLLLNCEHFYVDLNLVRRQLFAHTNKHALNAKTEYFKLTEIAETSLAIRELARSNKNGKDRLHLAVLVVHADDPPLFINETKLDIGYSRIYSALQDATDGTTIVVIANDKNYKSDSAKELMSTWAQDKLKSQFEQRFVSGPDGYIFSWNQSPMECHRQHW
ncbi:E3 ubiquitin-protein ligase TRIM33-like [Ptychodera flava]|uniref:E3 ubiquitin-protein ligase TRIM33-like n=1 Tax=Ptychodera flava TaxID=63121 RepID=UPI00396A3E58